MWLDRSLQSRGLPAEHQQDPGRRPSLLQRAPPRVGTLRPPGGVWQCPGMSGDVRGQGTGCRLPGTLAHSPRHVAQESWPQVSAGPRRRSLGSPLAEPHEAQARDEGEQEGERKETKLFVM